MFWADRLATEIEKNRKPQDGKRFLVRDEKTMSGRVHVGSMRSVAVHGIVAQVLAARGLPVAFEYEFNDFDPFDAIPSYLDVEQYTPHLGKPLYTVPSPEPGYANYVEYFADDFKKAHKKAGFTPTYYKATELYRSGKMDTFMRKALEQSETIRRIYKEVSGSQKPEGWLPISVVCEQCGKIMTTSVSDFDGDTVAYACNRNPDGAVSCGHTGRVAPWKGGAKFTWKVDWAAKWGALGVDVEGGGKDHSTKGGARDVANHIAREVFGIEPPFDTPYEFFLVGGKKMSSSKGSGSSAREMSELFPAELFRLLLIGKDIREQIDIDPSGESVPRLYDWYDELADGVRAGKTDDDYARLFALCQRTAAGPGEMPPWQMRFRDVAFVVQMPHLSLEPEAETAKGAALTAQERDALAERATYARFWLTTYAPEQFKYELQETLPETTLTEAQQQACVLLAQFLHDHPEADGEAIHTRLHAFKEEVPIAPKTLFQGLYRIFLNRDSGPKAGWFLAGLPRDFVVQRLEAAANA